MPNIIASDPRKARIVARLKELSGCRSVTNVRHNVKAGEFSGHCLNKGNRPDSGSRGCWAVYDDAGLTFAWRTLPKDPRVRLRNSEARDL